MTPCHEFSGEDYYMGKSAHVTSVSFQLQNSMTIRDLSEAKIQK